MIVLTGLIINTPFFLFITNHHKQIIRSKLLIQITHTVNDHMPHKQLLYKVPSHAPNITVTNHAIKHQKSNLKIKH